MTHTPKILMIATSAATMAPSDEPTGVWLEELTTPYYAFVDAGADVTLASIAGGAMPIDARSLKPKGENDASVERYYDDAALKEAVDNTPRFETLDPSSFANFCGRVAARVVPLGELKSLGLGSSALS